MRDVDAATQAAIEQLVTELLWRLDHDRADTIWELFAEDGVMTGAVVHLDGRAAIKAWGARRAHLTHFVGRHFTGGVRLAWVGGELHGTVQYATFRDTSPNPLVPASVGEFRDQYRLVDGLWRFSRREIVPVFGGDNAAAHARRLADGER